MGKKKTSREGSNKVKRRQLPTAKKKTAADKRTPLPALPDQAKPPETPEPAAAEATESNTTLTSPQSWPPPTGIMGKKLPEKPAVSRRKGLTRCIYFADGNDIIDLDTVASQHPHCSVSSIYQQLTKAFLEAYASKTDPGNAVKINAVVYL